MQRVMIIGCPGAGKSTFARALAEKTGLPLIHLDLIWHKPDRTHISRDEFDLRLAGILAEDRWIIDGHYSRTLAPRFEACDTLFWLDLPLEECLAGVRARIGQPRPDMPWQETKEDPEFNEYVRAFDGENRPQVETMLANAKNKDIRILRSRAEVDACLAAL